MERGGLSSGTVYFKVRKRSLVSWTVGPMVG